MLKIKKLKTVNSDFIKATSIIDVKRGNLVFCESKRQIPINIQRVYWISNVPSRIIRGGHAHKKTKQIIFCLKGSVRINLDDGRHRDCAILNKPDIGIYLGPMLWHTMQNFTKNTILLVLASLPYNEKDYIRDYSTFKTLISK